MNGKKLFWTLSVTAYLAMAWFISGVSKSDGLSIFSVAVVILAIAIFAYRRGWPRLVFSVFLGMILVAVTVAALEGMIRLKPNMIRGEVANMVYHGYHTGPG